LAGLTPDRIAGVAAAELERRPLVEGKRRGVLGDWFRVEASGEAADRLVIVAGDDRLDDIGAGMAAGELVVRGYRGGAGMAMSAASCGSRLGGYGRRRRCAAASCAHGRCRRSAGRRLPGEPRALSEGVVIIGQRRQLRRPTDAARAHCRRRRWGRSAPRGCSPVRSSSAAPSAPRPGVAMAAGSWCARRDGNSRRRLRRLRPYRLDDLQLIGRFLARSGSQRSPAHIGPLRRRVGDLALNARRILTPP